MNLRIKKKLSKRLFCKTYYGYRRKGLQMIAKEFIREWELLHPDVKDPEHIVHLIDSEKQDLRHVRKFEIFCDVKLNQQ